MLVTAAGQVNSHTAKPHKLVRVNDKLSFTRPSGPKITVVGLASTVAQRRKRLV